MAANVQKALISGASIAGPTLAYWLSHYGWQVVVVEWAAALRQRRQNVDVNGLGRQVTQFMGLEDAIRAVGMGEASTQFVNQHNQVQAAMGRDNPNGPTQELKIPRGDLVQLRYEHTCYMVEYRFDNTSTGLTQTAEAVKVVFASGHVETFAFVLVAEGVR